jgi:hypothetical protein
MHTFTPNRIQQERGYMICLRAERDLREKRCAGFEKAIEKTYRTEMAGAWDATLSNSVAGIREGLHESSKSGKAKAAVGRNGMLRRKSPQPRSADLTPGEDHWEAWAMFPTGEVVTSPMGESESEPSSLIVTRAGPTCSIGRKSVAVGFGTSVKLVLLGNELYDDGDEGLLKLNVRRRPVTRKYSTKAM